MRNKYPAEHGIARRIRMLWSRLAWPDALRTMNAGAKEDHQSYSPMHASGRPSCASRITHSTDIRANFLPAYF
jgi:hypothetical protein